MTRVDRLRTDLEELERFADLLGWLGEDHYDGEGTELGKAFDSAIPSVERIARHVRRELELEELVLADWPGPVGAPC